MGTGFDLKFSFCLLLLLLLFVCLFVFVFLHIVKHKTDNAKASISMVFTKKDGMVIFTEKKLSPLLITSNI